MLASNKLITYFLFISTLSVLAQRQEIRTGGLGGSNIFISGNLYVAGTNFGSNGFYSIGTNNGAIRLSGTNTGFQEFTVFSDGASNSLVLTLSAAARAGEYLVVYTNITQAGTNQIWITNATYSVATNELVMNQYYTNTGRRSFIGVSVQLTAAAAGTAKVSIRSEYNGVITNVISVSAGPLASLVTVEPLSMLIGPFCRYYITNETSGSGASVSVVNGTSSAIGL